MQEAWITYAALHGLTFEQMHKGHGIVGEDPEYYSRVGFAGLAESLRDKPVKDARELARDAADVNRKRF